MTAAEETKETAAKLINSFQDISFFKIACIVIGTGLAILLARKVLPALAARGPSQLRLFVLGAEPILRLLFLTTAIVWVVPIIFNITLQNFLVISGALGVAIGFAFKDYVSSLIAGIVAIFERPYRPGDWVEINGDYGEVRAVGLRTIILRTASDDSISVPHNRLWLENISNSNDGSRTLMCVASFYLQPNHDAARVRSALQDVALTSAYLSYEKPVLVQLQQDIWGSHYQLKAYPFDLRDQFAFISDLTVRGKLAIAETGAIEVATIPAKARDPE